MTSDWPVITDHGFLSLATDRFHCYFGDPVLTFFGMASDKSVFDVYREKLEDHEMMMGAVQGKLAVLLDLLTDSMIVAGKHSIYCIGKRTGEPNPDMEAITQGLLQSKELVQALMDHFRKQN